MRVVSRTRAARGKALYFPRRWEPPFNHEEAFCARWDGCERWYSGNFISNETNARSESSSLKGPMKGKSSTYKGNLRAVDHFYATMRPVLLRLGWWSTLMLAAAVGARAQISPGPLTRAHQSLEGATQCATCHNFGVGSKGFKCLECHVEVQRRVDSKSGYHARAYNVSRGQVDCTRCHLEHNGRQFQITKLDKAKFAHDELTAFALAGKHKTLACEMCHISAKIPAAAKAEIKVKDLNHTYLGLETTCAACHQDPHANQLGAECQRCHSQDAWKPAGGFDHSRTVYPLTGKHEVVACEKCHTPLAGLPSGIPPGTSVPRYKGLNASGCQGCHSDPHKGAFQEATFRGSCESCHVTSDWKALRPNAGFDHQQTKFPLHGKHADSTCAKCHKTTNFSEKVPHERCQDCHEDIHKGQFAKRAAGNDCSACHNETVFKPALFTREQHQTTKFPLQGKHAPMECVKCHKPEGRDANYMVGTLTCVSCHTDPHGGEFLSAPHENQCESCHSQNVFHPSTYDVARHSKTKFALAGAHVAVVCAECHKPLANIASTPASAAAVQYHFSEQACTVCHADPHRTGLGPSKEPCETCHNVRQWKELRSFNHSATKFPLEGAHQPVQCVGCHRSTSAKSKTLPDFTRTPLECAGCHEDIHGGQFASGGAEKDCLSCHSISKWSAGEFDHNKTNFVLSGAHDKVRCAQCHTQQIEKEGRQIRLYRGTPTQCKDCHGNMTVQ